ncbi:tRNA(ANN) t(6)A37 threonylcarbamoyladenosine modification protein [Sodalis praecaptivus]|uniref:Threonylcarbamoyl-AMP synthase n=1 Tax=Sodalis praecaptivus TaxID=1239307 RepID=W0HNZ0_9GAMM|nr:L-threonylcarbamoyladenylate synthase type 1 TsaC [Sodalis praecaptivus]AHF75571.1 tRNA(ANN) t(6)A37 threonylcarbamoyladenosine modification protein [Sodalis praecaptivus]CAJ0999593.1 Threonylcarbamoyl-AMP synthase [Sodalis praecaptivus]
MKNETLLPDLTNVVTALRQQQVIAYPTEAVFGLGCDPDSESAVQALLKLKQRPWQKGLILVAAHYAQLTDYIDDSALDNAARERMFACWPGPVTWVVPARPTTPRWLTGQYASLAVRVSAFEPVRRLCLAFGKPLVSTSANLTGLPPARTAGEVREQLGAAFPVLDQAVEGRRNPSEIRDALSGELIRQG